MCMLRSALFLVWRAKKSAQRCQPYQRRSFCERRGALPENAALYGIAELVCLLGKIRLVNCASTMAQTDIMFQKVQLCIWLQPASPRTPQYNTTYASAGTNYKPGRTAADGHSSSSPNSACVAAYFCSRCCPAVHGRNFAGSICVHEGRHATSVSKLGSKKNGKE